MSSSVLVVHARYGDGHVTRVSLSDEGHLYAFIVWRQAVEQLVVAGWYLIPNPEIWSINNKEDRFRQLSVSMLSGLYDAG